MVNRATAEHSTILRGLVGSTDHGLNVNDAIEKHWRTKLHSGEHSFRRNCLRGAPDANRQDTMPHVRDKRRHGEQQQRDRR